MKRSNHSEGRPYAVGFASERAITFPVVHQSMFEVRIDQLRDRDRGWVHDWQLASVFQPLENRMLIFVFAGRRVVGPEQEVLPIRSDDSLPGLLVKSI